MYGYGGVDVLCVGDVEFVVMVFDDVFDDGEVEFGVVVGVVVVWIGVIEVMGEMG